MMTIASTDFITAVTQWRASPHDAQSHYHTGPRNQNPSCCPGNAGFVDGAASAQIARRWQLRKCHSTKGQLKADQRRKMSVSSLPNAKLRKTVKPNDPVLVKPKKSSRRRGPLCKCKAYPWPHRPSSGLCLWPDPPLESWRGTAGKSKPSGARINRGIRRRLANWMGWHPLGDRAYIERWMPKLYVAYCRRRGYPGGDEWLRHHGLGRIPAMRVTADGRDSKETERAPDGTPDPAPNQVPRGSGRAVPRRRIEDCDVWAVRWRGGRPNVSREC